MSYSRYDRDQSGNPTGTIVAIGVIAIVVMVVVIIVGSLVKRVDPGYAGVIVEYGSASSEPKITSVEPGQLKLIGLTQRFFAYPISQQTLTMVRAEKEGQIIGDDSVKCQDKNGVPLHIDSSVLWRVDVSKAGQLYLLRPELPLAGKEGADISSMVVRQDVRAAIGLACSYFRYDEVFSIKKVELGLKVTEILGPALEKSFLKLDSFLLREIHLEKQQEDAIAAKVVAEQQSLQAQYAKAKAEYEAQGKVAEAEGAAKVKVLQAEAEAKSIAVINEQLGKSPFYVQYVYAKSWNGALPTTLVLSNGQSIPLVQNLPLVDGQPTVVPPVIASPTPTTPLPTATKKP